MNMGSPFALQSATIVYEAIDYSPKGYETENIAIGADVSIVLSPLSYVYGYNPENITVASETSLSLVQVYYVYGYGFENIAASADVSIAVTKVGTDPL